MWGVWIGERGFGWDWWGLRVCLLDRDGMNGLKERRGDGSVFNLGKYVVRHECDPPSTHRTNSRSKTPDSNSSSPHPRPHLHQP